LVILLLVYALLAFVAYAFVPFEQLLLSNQTPSPVMAATARWLIGLGEGGGVLILYVVFGISGFGFARRLGLPGFFVKGPVGRVGCCGPPSSGWLSEACSS